MTTKRRHGVSALLGLALLHTPFRGDLYDATAELRRLAPDLDQRMARHLIRDDDAQFRAFARASGINDVKDAFLILDKGLSLDSREAYRRTGEVLFPYMIRVTSALGTEYGCTEYQRDLDFRMARGDSGLELKRMRWRFDSLTVDAGMPLEEKSRLWSAFAAECERIGYHRLLAAIEASRGRDVMRNGDLAARGRYLRSAVAIAKVHEERLMICQLLGELGDFHARDGDRDSMLACFLEGIALADRHRFPDQAARLRSFLASNYIEEGRLALAGDLLRDAQLYCRRFGGGPSETRMVFRMMRLYADLGCWEIVRSHWNRLPVLLRGLNPVAHHLDRGRYELEAELWSARIEARSGSPRRAAARMTSLLGRMRSTHGREALALIHTERAQALLVAGDARATLAAIDEGLAYADSFHTPADAVDLATLRVRAALAAGNLRLAENALDEARRRMRAAAEANAATNASLVRARCAQEGLAARIALARGRRSEALGRIHAALVTLRNHVASLDESPQSYLVPGRVDDLRWVAHEALAADAEASLRMELAWRALPAGPRRTSRSVAAAVPRRQESESALHVVYATTSSGIIRWTRRGGECRREVVGSVPEYQRLADRMMRLVASDPLDPEAPPPAELRQLAERLGGRLLPPELQRGEHGTVVISAEGALARLPFEALDADPGPAYVPLLAVRDVVYGRPVEPRAEWRGDGSSLYVIGTADALTPSMSGMSPLSDVESEIASARRRLPAGSLLRSTATSKSDLLAALNRASLVYVAAHQARDAEAPLFAYFPMTFGARAGSPEDRYLDLGDLRAVDFSRCELAVLSSCASGEPYVVDGRSGPSMADVILDAGAQSVIHTRWRVRDDQAARVAPELARAWVRARARADAIAAFSQARRALIRGARGTRHPFGWAAWSATIAEPVAPWPLPSPSLTARNRRRGPGGPAAPRETRALARSSRADAGGRR